MTVLVDFSQLSISSIQAFAANPQFKNVLLTEDMLRHIILNSLREVAFKFKSDHEIVICCDTRTKKYWRKEIFPFYKANRKKLRDASNLDWNLIHSVLNELMDAIRDYFPYKLIENDRAEADDIIGTLTPRISTYEPVIIVSTDGDFKQLSKYKNVKQYNKKLNVYIKSDDPILELKEKIIVGDRGDGIPSCISPNNVFVEGIRQKPVTKKLKSYFMEMDFNLPDKLYKDYIERNMKLIDLSYTPQDIKDEIIMTYETDQSGSKVLVKKYFIEKKLNNLLSVLDEF